MRSSDQTLGSLYSDGAQLNVLWMCLQDFWLLNLSFSIGIFGTCHISHACIHVHRRTHNVSTSFSYIILRVMGNPSYEAQFPERKREKDFVFQFSIIPKSHTSCTYQLPVTHPLRIVITELFLILQYFNMSLGDSHLNMYSNQAVL